LNSTFPALLQLAWVDDRLFRVPAVKARDLAYGLYDFCITLRSDIERPFFALITITPQFNLDEFVVIQSAFYFGNNRRAQTLVSDGYQRFQVVGLAPQIFLLRCF
jgi:hypothetical protein